jgi:hypothetical protein
MFNVFCVLQQLSNHSHRKIHFISKKGVGFEILLKCKHTYGVISETDDNSKDMLINRIMILNA